MQAATRLAIAPKILPFTQGKAIAFDMMSLERAETKHWRQTPTSDRQPLAPHLLIF